MHILQINGEIAVVWIIPNFPELYLMNNYGLLQVEDVTGTWKGEACEPQNLHQIICVVENYGFLLISKWGL